jgi:hypothetical protein
MPMNRRRRPGDSGRFRTVYRCYWSAGGSCSEASRPSSSAGSPSRCLGGVVADVDEALPLEPHVQVHGACREWHHPHSSKPGCTEPLRLKAV